MKLCMYTRCICNVYAEFIPHRNTQNEQGISRVLSISIQMVLNLMDALSLGWENAYNYTP